MTQLLNFIELGKEHSNSIIILHGLFGSLKNWNSVAKNLSQSNHVVMVDLRNHGDSFHSEIMNYQVMAIDIHHLLNHLDINQCVLIGHSMGGKVAMQCAQDFPHLIYKLVVVDIAPVAYKHSYDSLIDPILKLPLEHLKNRNHANKLLENTIEDNFIRLFLLQSLAKNDNGWYWKIAWENIKSNMPFITDAPKLSTQIPISSYFIFGENSTYSTPLGDETIKQKFNHVSISTIPNADHWLHHSHSEIFLSYLDEFLLQ